MRIEITKAIAPTLGLMTILFTAEATAQTFIQGRVVNSGNAGIQGVDIDVFEVGKDKPLDLLNDGTDASGNFLTEVLDGPDNYDIQFTPPRGYPAMPAKLLNIFVVGTKNLGTIALDDAFLISGRVVDLNNTPVALARLSVEDLATGDLVEIAHFETDSGGFFDLAVPAGNYNLYVDPAKSSSPLFLAPTQVLNIALNSNVNVGTLQLQPGLVLSATVRRSNGSGIANVDVDVVESTSGEKLFTPNDGSDNLGFVDVTVPAGTYHVQFEPQLADKLAAHEIRDVVVSADQNFGTITLLNGWYVSGNVKNSAGQNLFDIDFDAFDSATGTEVFVPASHTNASGNYQVVLAPGTYDLEYRAPYDQPLHSHRATSTVINSDRTLNVTLTDCPAVSHYGNGGAGSGGFVPTITHTALPRLGTPQFGFQVDSGLGGATCTTFIGLVPINAPGKGWELLVLPILRVRAKLSGPNGVAGVGSLLLESDLPKDPSLDGVSLYLQAIIFDPGALGGIAATDGMQIPLCY